MRGNRPGKTGTLAAFDRFSPAAAAPPACPKRQQQTKPQVPHAPLELGVFLLASFEVRRATFPSPDSHM